MDLPKPLLDDIATGRCLPFVGAGFSLNCASSAGAKMPDWEKLTETLAKEGNIDINLPQPKIASLYEHLFGRVQLIEAIRRSLHVDEIEIGDAHREFASLPFDTVYTTNFDLLLESAYQELKKPFRSLVGELQMPFYGGPLSTNIVKMHGDLRHEEHMIITEEDYKRYIKDYPVIATHLSAMLITKTALFLGYSLSDSDFQHIKEIVSSRLGKFERMAYIIQFDTLPQNIEKMLEMKLHCVNLETSSKKSRTEAIVEFLKSVRTYVDTKEVSTLRQRRAEAFEPLDKGILTKLIESPNSSILLTSSSNLCFVIMPMGTEYDTVYSDLIVPVTEKLGLKVLRSDELYLPGVITEQIRAAIYQSRICVAEISEANPNVMYEVGIAVTLSKPIVLLSRSGRVIPFDLKEYRVFLYSIEGSDEQRALFEEVVRQVLGDDRLIEAELRLKQGDTGIAVFQAAVYFEQVLNELVRQNEVKIKTRITYMPQRLSMGQMLDYLKKLDIISKNDVPMVQQYIDLRNRAVHDLYKPTIKETDSFIKFVRDFASKYLSQKE